MPYREYYKRQLPHWQPNNATIFVTFRLVDSLPRTLIQDYYQAREIEKVNLPTQQSITYQNIQVLLDNKQFTRWNDALDHPTESPKWLAQSEIADIAAEAIHYRDGKFYDLLAYTIMPNHIHFVVRIGNLSENNPDPPALHTIMSSLKRHTARQANLLLGREGAFWHAENYDHVVRNEVELNRIIYYVLYNPVKAGLVEYWEDWRWSYLKSE